MKAQLTLLSLFAIAISALSGCEAQLQQTMQETDSTPTTTVKTQTMTQQLAAPVAGDKIAIIETDMGTIKFKIFGEQVPEIAKNFEELSKQGNFDNVPFHRVMKDFMIQTGDFTMKNGYGGHSYKGPGTSIDDEFNPGLKHLYGTVSMANSGPNTNGSQFFIVTNKNGTPHLDGIHSVFGQVYEGMDVALAIADLQSPGTQKPSREINMDKVTVEVFNPNE